MKIIEVIALEREECDTYVCDCGNSSDGNGFHPCDENGKIVEPLKDSE